MLDLHQLFPRAVSFSNHIWNLALNESVERLRYLLRHDSVVQKTGWHSLLNADDDAGKRKSCANAAPPP
jgi:hypothetical protein